MMRGAKRATERATAHAIARETAPNQAAGPTPDPALSPTPDPAPALTVERIVVGREKMSITVALAPHAPRYTAPALAAALIERVPSLPQHACVNANGPTFGHVIERTPIPHVLEHLIIDGQCDRALSAPRDFLYMGTTEWMDETAGRARIEVNFSDDLETLRALRDGLSILNELLQSKW